MSMTLIAVFLLGTLGWTGLPIACNIVADAMLRLITKRALGVHHIYTDDFISGSSLRILLNDKPMVVDVIQRAFNPGAWRVVKSIDPTQEGEALGWKFSFREGKARPRDRAIRKLTAAFFYVSYRSSSDNQTMEMPSIAFESLCKINHLP
jgi:hypothetical protein